jgi:hypothetical protein
MKLTFSNEQNAGALAVFCKRVTYDDAYRRSDGETEAERMDMAYRILSAIAELGACLGEEGYSHR